MKLAYVTKNTHKFEHAKTFFDDYDVELAQQALSILEIQSDDVMAIAVQKAKDAWEQLHEPLFVNDASWAIPALKGFPGPYMKYVNRWFDPMDFVHLMEGKNDRTIILKDVIVYIDATGSTVFTNEHKGTLLDSVTPGVYRHPSDAVISLSKTGASILEEVNKGISFIEGEDKVWRAFASWVKTKHG